jgi:hypothetical protein
MQTTKRFSSGNNKNRSGGSFDTKLLKHLGDPLAKSAMRYDSNRNILVSDEINAAFRISDDGRTIYLDPRLAVVLAENETTTKTESNTSTTSSST